MKNRYRLMWMDAVYEPGEVKVVAYNKEGKAVAEKVVRTAGKPHHIELVSNRNELTADGKDLAYVTVKVVDKDGNPCPTDNRQINFSAKGTGNIVPLPMATRQSGTISSSEDACFQRNVDSYHTSW